MSGPAGTIIGGATAGSKTNEITTQKRVNRTENVDTGDMLFTNADYYLSAKKLQLFPTKKLFQCNLHTSFADDAV